MHAPTTPPQNDCMWLIGTAEGDFWESANDALIASVGTVADFGLLKQLVSGYYVVV